MIIVVVSLDGLSGSIYKENRISFAILSKEKEQQDEIHFEIIVIDDDVRLAIAQLNERKDKYLCIYVEFSAPNQEILSQLRNAII
jgi:hypothetical protein